MTEEILFKEKEIVIPGQVLAKGMGYVPGEGTFREEDNIIATQLGLAKVNGRLIKLVPLNGSYVPKEGDVVIGRIAEITFSNWLIDFGFSNFAAISLKDGSSDYIEKGADLTKYYDYEDYVVTKIVNVTSSNMIDLTMKGPGLRKITGGKIIEVTASKVPRMIGKQASMINLIKENTNCQIVIGQNGLVWIKGDKLADEIRATDAIMMIEENAHIEGLTEKVKEFLGGKQ